MRCALAGALLAAALAQAADPVAFVADIRGNATIEGNGPLNFLAELAPGTRLLLGSGAAAAVTFASSGAEFTVTGPGEFLVTPVEVKTEKGAAPKRRTVGATTEPGAVGRISRSATASFRMRGIPPPIAPSALDFPVETRVATLQPVMRVRGDAEERTIAVTDAEGKEVWHGPAKALATRVGVRLSPDTRYTWTVVTPSGALGSAWFETLSAAAIARAENARASARTFPGRVVLAVVLQDIGAAQEARQAWTALARERPDLPELAALAR